jgi:hypothetical protein
MPKKGNYNHDYYKLRGKEPGNQDVQPEQTRKEYATLKKKGTAKGTTAPKKKRK